MTMTKRCPHSSKRTCDGGMNSCVGCPKHSPGHLAKLFITLVLAIILLFFCTRCTIDHKNYVLIHVADEGDGISRHMVRYKDTGKIYLVIQRNCIDSVLIESTVSQSQHSGFALEDPIKP